MNTTDIMSSSSAGVPPASDAQQQQQPSTSAANSSLNVQVNNQGPAGASMMSPHPGPSSQPDNRYGYPYSGKQMSYAMQQRPMAPQQWPQHHIPDASSDPMSLSQPPPSNYSGQQQGYSLPPPPNMYNNPQLPPSSGNSGYWVQQQQQPRYPIHQQQYTPGYGPVHHQAYAYPPMQQSDWGRMPPMQHYPQTSQPMQQPMPLPSQQTLPPPQQLQQQQPQQAQQQLLPPPPQAPIQSQSSSSNIAAAAQALQSPGATSSLGGHDETPDDTKSIRSTSSVPPPHTPARTPAATPSASATPGTSTSNKTTSTPASSAKHAPPPTREEVLEKLCHTNDQIGPEMIMQRRAFFETVMTICERDGEALTGPPQVSKSPIDLHKLYLKVKEKGGWEQVTKDKVWKNLCVHANPDMSESSAAGYQLRRHYQRHLLRLECIETGKNMDDLIAVAEKQKKKKKEKDPASNPSSAKAGPPPPPPPQPQQSQPQQPQISQPPPPQQTLQPPPQPYSQPPHGVPQPGQPGPSYAVDANGQPIPGYGQPGLYGYGVPQGWGAPPHGYPHYGQQPRYPPHIMMPPVQQAQQPQQMQMPQQHGMPPPGPSGVTSQQQQPSAQPQQQQQPGRPPMDQASYEEHQRQVIQQQRPSSTATSNAATPQPPQCSTAPGIPEQQQQPLKTHTSIAPSTPSVATSRAPSVGVSQATSHPQSSSTSQPATSSSSAVPQTSLTSSDGSSALANQLGQPPPMGMYPPHPSMGMYGQQRMPYPSHQGIPNGYPQQPLPQQQEGQNAQQQQGQQHPGMYSHPSQQMYGQQMSQGWNPQMMRPPMPQGYPGMPGQLPPGQQPPPQSQQVQQPGQSSAEFWQHQQRTALAAASTQQQGQRKPYFPQNQPQPQASPQPSQRLQPQQQQHQTPNVSAPQQQPPIPPPQQQKMMSASQPGPSQPLPSSQVTPQTSMHHRQMAMAGPSQHLQQSQQHHLLQQHIPPPITFPPNSVEATAQQHLGPQRRLPKKSTKDLISATPRRIMMALKSNIHMEIVWALNALTVMLYDDSINPPTLSTEILNIIIEHFRASLSLVFPKAFSLDDVVPTEISSTNENSSSADIWKQVINEAEKSGETVKTKVKLPPAMKNSLGKDLNSVSRGGLKIITKDAEMPTKLKEWKDSSSLLRKKLVNKEMSYEERRKLGLPTQFAYKVAESTRCFIEQSFVKSDKVKFSKWADSDIKHFEYDDDVQPKYFENQNNIDLEDYYDHEAPLDCSLVPRPIGTFLIPDTIQAYSQLCLAWSNVIRGFSFNPANEQYLVNHNGLLRLIGRLLMLYVEKGDTPKQLSRKRKQQIDEKEGKLNIDELKETTPEEDAATKSEEEKKRAAMVSTEKDDMKSYLLEISNQLRDDAFTILSFISGSIDLFDLDSGISYPIFDALIHWTVSHSVLSKDPLVPWGIICPRDFCLEIVAKMSVIDHNVDLFLSTGSPKRIEEFVRIVSDLLHMGEDTPIREFALVIMSALCQASEDICVVAALETNIVKNVISFMEAVDSKMHEVVSTKGMNELRTNPECIGTSIGMLRRAGYLLGYIVQYETCRKPFLKYMNNLINLTISHYMDTRVAIQIASIVHMAQLANIDSVSGKCLDVPDTPSVEPEILFPNKLPKFPKTDDNDRSLPPKKGPEENKLNVPKLNGIKRPYDDDSAPSTSNSTHSLEMIVENGTPSQVNGIQQNGSHESFKSPVRINGIHKHNKDNISPKQDVKAILRNSINHKQEAAAGPTSSKRAKLEVNGVPTNGRINGTSPSTTANGPTSSAATSSSTSSMAIVT
jgi:hypothetical protein